MLKLGMRVRTWDYLPHAKFCLKKSLKGIYPSEVNLYQKFEIFETLSYISRHFVPIMLTFERTWETLGIPQGHKILSQSLKGYCTGPAGIAWPRR